MTINSQMKWDQRYRNRPLVEPMAAQVLSENLHLLPTVGSALDLASGLGGNARLLAIHGLETTAWDISAVAMELLDSACDKAGLTIHTQKRDIVENPPHRESFDVIVVARFLDRSVCPYLIAALKPQGVLFYQTFTVQNTGSGGPMNPDYLLRKNELIGLFSELTVLSFRDEGVQGNLHKGLRNESWIIARKEHS